MIPLTFLNSLYPPVTNLLVFLISLAFATAAGVTAFLLISSGNMRNFKKNIFSKGRLSHLPIVTSEGNVVDTKDELDAHLEILESKLLEKVGEIASSKTKINDAKESIEKLHSTQAQVKKYYIKLKEEIKRSEEDCKRLQSQIDDYREKRAEVEKEMKNNVEHYKNLVKKVKANESSNSLHTSSKSSLNSGDSSQSSYYDSSPHTNDGQATDRESTKTKNYRRIKTRSKTTTLSLSPSKESFPKMSTLPNNSITSPSKCSLFSPTNELNDNLSSKEVLRDNSKTNLKRKGSIGHKPSAASSGRSRNPKHKCTENICCCGSIKCMGSCNFTKSLKLGSVKPKEVLNLDVAQHVDIATGEIISGKDCSHKRVIMEESRIKMPSISRLTK